MALGDSQPSLTSVKWTSCRSSSPAVMALQSLAAIDGALSFIPLSCGCCRCRCRSQRHCHWLSNTCDPGAGKMAQQFRAYTALTEDPSSAPSIQIRWVTSFCNCSSRRSMPSSGLFGYCTHMLSIHTCKHTVHMHWIHHLQIPSPRLTAFLVHGLPLCLHSAHS